jgi:hypothetical protein
MNSAIEIHDSSLTSIRQRGPELELRLSAYIHKSEGTPGTETGTGWLQDVTLVLDSGSVEGSIASWPADLQDGALEIDGEVSENIIPIPLDRSGTIQLTLEPKWGGRIVVYGKHIHLELQGAPKYVEDFPGDTKT